MPSAFTLFGEIRVDHKNAITALQQTEKSLERTTKAMNRTEQATARVGAVSRRAATDIQQVSRSASASGGAIGALGRGFASIGLTAGAMAYGIGRAAIDVDNMMNVLRAATGSTEAARLKFQQLNAVAQASPGVLSSVAVSTYALLKPMQVTEGTIDQLIQAFGRIKLANPSADIQGFAFNLNQLAVAFDKMDFKQAVENFPRFGEIVKKAFDLEAASDNIEGLIEELKKLQAAGKLSKEAWLKGFAEAANSDVNLGKLEDTLGTKFEKLAEALKLKVEPLGKSVLDTFLAGFNTPADEPDAGFMTMGVALADNLARAAKVVGERADGINVEMQIAILKAFNLKDPALHQKFREQSATYWKEVGDTLERDIQKMKVGRLQESQKEWATVLTSGISDPAVIKNAEIKLAEVSKKLVEAQSKSLELAAPKTEAAIKQSLADGIVGARTTALTGGFDIGADLGRGVVNGIRSKMDDVGAVAGQMGGVAEIGLRNRVKTQSPSKVFFAIGKDVAQGFIDGIASMKTGIYAAMASVLDISGIKGLAKKDAEGVTLLTELIRELDELTPRTKSQAIAAQLTAGAYKNLNAEVRKRIELAAAELTRLEKLQKFYDDMSKRFSGGSFGGDSSGEVTPEGNRPIDDMLAGIQGIVQVLSDGSNPFDAIMDKLNPMPTLKPMWDNFWATMSQRIDYFKSTLPSVKQALGENLLNSFYQIGDVLGNAVANWDGTLKGFFKSLAQGFRQLIGQLISELIKLMMYKLIFSILGGVAGGMGGGASGGASTGLGGAGGISGGAGLGGGGWGGVGGGMASGVSDLAAGFGGSSMMAPAAASSTYNQNVTVNMPSGSGGSITAEQVARVVISQLRRVEMKNK